MIKVFGKSKEVEKLEFYIVIGKIENRFEDFF